MKLLYFVESLTGMYFNDDHIYMASGGILFENNFVNSDIYLKGLNNISFFNFGLIKTMSLINNNQEQVIQLSDLELFRSAFLAEQENPYICDFYDSVLVMYNRNDDGESKSTYLNLIDGKRITPKNRGGNRYADKDCILVSKSGFLYCSDWSGELLWQRKFTGAQGRYSPNCLFENINNGILINMGELSDGSGAIVLLEKMTGNVIWEKLFPTRIEDSYLINQKIYCCMGNKMMIMNLQGEIEREFVADTEDQQHLSFWTDEKLLYVFTMESNQIIVYSMEGKLIRHYQFSDQNKLWHGSKARRFGNTNYLQIGSGGDLIGVEDGLLTWTPDEILAGKELEFEERPAISIQSIKEEDKTESYHIHVPCTDIRELLLHTEIEVRRLLTMRAKGYYIENKETRNKKFNGKVQLFINPAIGEEFCPHLDMLVKRCQHFAESSFMTSANGKKEIAISLNFSH